MTDKKDMKNTAFNLLEKNETIVTKYYKLSTYIFLGVVAQLTPLGDEELLDSSLVVEDTMIAIRTR